jgi:type I restriction enzyme, S subunit
MGLGMPEAAFHDQSLGTLFRLKVKPVFPALEPGVEFHHHSLPAWDSTGRPAIEPGSSIESNKVLLDEPAVLVSKLNPRKPRVAVVVPRAGERHCASTEFMCFVPRNPNENLSYWVYYLGSNSFCARLQRVAIGSTNSHTRASPSEVIRWTVPNPPNAQKRVIAEVLDTLDTTIRQTEAIIEKLKQVKQGLLHDLLTRGIDANGELRPPQSQAPHLYKDSPLGWIPREWLALPFGKLAEFVNGNSFDASRWSEQGLPIIRIQNLNGSTDFNFYDGPVNSKWHVLPGDLLFAWSGQRGVSFGPRIWAGPEGVLNQHIFRVTERKPLVSKRYLFEALRSRQGAIEDSAHGFKDSFLHVTRGELGSVMAGIPSLAEQAAIANRIEAFERRLNSELMTLAKCNALKSGLMDDLLTGRVRVTPLLDAAALA